nr:MAG: RNA polymerase Rpb1, domain 2 [Bacteriophage sp.]
MSYNEARQWLLDHNIIGKKATSNTIGYRIPTQAQSSIHALRFVDVVPAIKSTVILPTEFTKITGSDFDIDHLYLARYNVNKDGKYEFDPESAEGL